MAKHGPETRRQILRAALKRFANAGYAATSVQQIVGTRRCPSRRCIIISTTRPGCFRRWSARRIDERLRVVQQAAARRRIFAGNWWKFSPRCSIIFTKTAN